MLVIIGDQDKAAVSGGTDLCRNCRYLKEHTYALTGSQERWCCVAVSMPIRLHGPVALCRDFFPQTHPYLSEMREIAWKLEFKGSREMGFKVTRPTE